MYRIYEKSNKFKRFVTSRSKVSIEAVYLRQKLRIFERFVDYFFPRWYNTGVKEDYRYEPEFIG
jgi:hypothetical protein